MVSKLQNSSDVSEDFDETDELEMRLYFIENPEARKHK